ncbi:hypothetical protein [uncultured Tateyamaria sp.]|uniref:hypothetical protein n=1 Tax=uncultured Tateyamaria sp. TaxID=455651 RepID=UPI002612266A|nr:hypothetical protein [uncultured Tateyamaria sp.]
MELNEYAGRADGFIFEDSNLQPPGGWMFTGASPVFPVNNGELSSAPSLSDTGSGNTFRLDPAQLPNDDLPTLNELAPLVVTEGELNFLLRLGERVANDPNVQDDIDRLIKQDEITYIDRLEIAGEILDSRNEGYYDDLLLEAANWPAPDRAPSPPPIVEVLPISDTWWSPGEETWDNGGAWGGGLSGWGGNNWDAFYTEYSAIF